MGEAFRIAGTRLAEDATALARLREDLWQRLRGLPQVFLNGEGAPRIPGILNLSFGGVEGESLRASLPELAGSSGSACSAGTGESSYVLRALGRDDDLANASLRFSLGRFTTQAEIHEAAAQVIGQVQRLRALSPLWQESGARA
jgi:cysteine desulfurase